MNIPYSDPQYVKKEDVREFVNNQRKVYAIMFFALAIVVSLIVLLILPELINFYKTFGLPVPNLIRFLPYGTGITSVVILMISAYLLLSKPNYSKIDTIARQYKAGEMIKTRELIGTRKLPWFILLILALSIGFIVVHVFLPIYSLSNQY